MDAPLLISLEDAPNPEDVQSVSKSLMRFNRQHAPDDHYRPITIFLRQSDQTLMGGLLGETYWGWLHVDILWLDEKVRGQGLGHKMLQLAEHEAWQRGCRGAHLDTMDWQALPFYEKLGYTVFGVLEDLPEGHKRYFLSKKLNPVENPIQ
jgi:GNAT superfamily N-acetyltransferase